MNSKKTNQPNGRQPSRSIGRCFRCGSPLYKSDIPEYTSQCFTCDEDFYAFEQLLDEYMEVDG